MASTSKPSPMIMPTVIMVRKSAHALVVRERWVPNLYATELNMPSLTSETIHQSVADQVY